MTERPDDFHDAGRSDPTLTAATAAGGVSSQISVDDSELRGRERWRRIVLAAFGNAGARTMAIVGALVTIPLVIQELGTDRYGVLVLITQFSTLLVFADLGIGNGLITNLSRSLAKGRDEESRELISSAAVMLSGAAALIGACTFAVFQFVPWAPLLGMDEPRLAGEVAPSVAVFVALYLVGVPLALAEKVHLAYQEGLHTGLWQMLGAASSVAATILCVIFDAGVPWFVAATTGGPVLGNALNAAWLLYRRPLVRPRLSHVRGEAIRTLARAGGLFFVLAAAGAIAFQTDSLVIAHMLDAEDVTTYNLALRMFSLPAMAVSFVVAPLWPAFGDALARGETQWVRRTIRKSILLASAVNVPGALLLLLAGEQILELWVGRGVVDTPFSLFAAFALWTMLNSINGPLAMLLNGAHVIGFQVVCAISMAIANLALSIILTDIFGVAGPILGTLIAHTFLITIPMLVYAWRRGWIGPVAVSS